MLLYKSIDIYNMYYLISTLFSVFMKFSMFILA